MPDDQTLALWRVPLDRGLEFLSPVSLDEERAGTHRIQATQPPIENGRLVVHPRYRSWLARCGVTNSETVLSLPGEVVSGHTDRHVVRVELQGGSGSRAAYLKREHVTGLRWRIRNWLDGFGRVSRCEREAKSLTALEAAGLPGPQWLAYGEDAQGRAFLLVEDLSGAEDLISVLRDRQDGTGKRVLAERIGVAIAELHAAGFSTPDLAAKHLMIGRDNSVTLIDWQSAPQPGHVRVADLVRWFGTLHAGVMPVLANSKDRLRLLWAYRREMRRNGRAFSEPFSSMARAIDSAAVRRGMRSSVRAQRHLVECPQRLVWVCGEAVVAVPEVAAVWPTPAQGKPYYQSGEPTPPLGDRERVLLPNGRPAVLVRFRTVDPVGRIISTVRERPWRSPAAYAARVLFHLERHGILAPQLLAFGQRMTSAIGAESFLCADLPHGVVSLSDFLLEESASLAQRASVLAECGRLLSCLHSAGLRTVDTRSANDPLFVVSEGGTVSVGSPFAVRMVRNVSRSQRGVDLARFVAPFDTTVAGWVQNGYHGANG